MEPISLYIGTVHIELSQCMCLNAEVGMQRFQGIRRRTLCNVRKIKVILMCLNAEVGMQKFQGIRRRTLCNVRKIKVILMCLNAEVGMQKFQGIRRRTLCNVRKIKVILRIKVVTAKLISAFVFATQIPLLFKSEISSL